MHQLTHQGNFLSPDEWPVTGLPDEERDDLVQVAGDALSQPADQCCQAERGKNCWLLPSEENRGNPAWHHQAERDDCRYAVILCHIQHLTVATTKHAPEVIGKKPGGCNEDASCKQDQGQPGKEEAQSQPHDASLQEHEDHSPQAIIMSMRQRE